MEVEKTSEFLPRLLTEETKWGIIISIKYYNQTYSSIEQKFGIKRGTISKIWKKYSTFGNVDNNYKVNNNALKSNEMVCEQVKSITEQSELVRYSLFDIQQNLLLKYQLQISKSSIVKIMNKLQFKYGSSRFIHQLTEKNQKDRVDYCKFLSKQNLNEIAFSDEAVFCTSDNGCKIWYRNIQERLIKRKQYQYVDVLVHVWACMSTRGKSGKFMHDESVDSSEYIKCITEHFLPFKYKNHRNGN